VSSEDLFDVARSGHGGSEGSGVSRASEISEFGDSHDSATTEDPASSPHLHAIWNELMSLKQVVENEHDHKLSRIETDLRWTMMLVGAQFITIIGSAIAMLVGG
jgi:hypothetical protein